MTANPVVRLKIRAFGYFSLLSSKILLLIFLASPVCLNSGATINPELDTKLPFSQEEIKEKPAHLPSAANAIIASPFFIFASRSSGERPEIPVPREIADDKVTSQICLTQNVWADLVFSIIKSTDSGISALDKNAV
ncbi:MULTISPECIES: hypothetical protein [Flavobacterium]|uniref:hypothetical protein n=1 Tax=Flavobacterium TaxID=237 RepID=UPI00164341CF|nr:MULTISPECIES: hypothetical protein [Flavobacterium]MCR4029738.1 hypothetical protein [Flavobacterium panacis]